MDPDVRIAKFASAHYGALTHAAATAAGFSPAMVKRRLARELWVRLHHGVYALAGVPADWRQELMAAWLAVGTPSALSCISAGRIWDLVTVSGEPHVTRLSGSTRRPGITVHRSIEIDAASYQGFRVTHPMRTLLDLGGYLEEEVLEIAVDRARRRGLVEFTRFATYLDLPRNREKTGSGVLRALLGLRKGSRPLGSDHETILFAFLRRHGLPAPVPQHPVMTRSGIRYVDFAYPKLKVAIEFDSWEWHSDRMAFDDERARRNELEELGWHVLQITSTQVSKEPVVVASTVGNALALIPTRWSERRTKTREATRNMASPRPR